NLGQEVPPDHAGAEEKEVDFLMGKMKAGMHRPDGDRGVGGIYSARDRSRACALRNRVDVDPHPSERMKKSPRSIRSLTHRLGNQSQKRPRLPPPHRFDLASL